MIGASRPTQWGFGVGVWDLGFRVWEFRNFCNLISPDADDWGIPTSTVAATARDPQVAGSTPVLQCVAMRCSVCCSMLQCVAVCVSSAAAVRDPQVAGSTPVLPRVAVRCSVCCSMLQCVAVCCSVYQLCCNCERSTSCGLNTCVAVCCRVTQYLTRCRWQRPSFVEMHGSFAKS